MIIAPSLLSANFLNLEKDIQMINESKAEWLHLDIIDGQFAPNITFGIPVIEDAAHTWDTFLTEEVERGNYICYSFQAIKFLTTGDGGALVCDDPEIGRAHV